jgi:hypothetical protein
VAGSWACPHPFCMLVWLHDACNGTLMDGLALRQAAAATERRTASTADSRRHAFWHYWQEPQVPPASRATTRGSRQGCRGRGTLEVSAASSLSLSPHLHLHIYTAHVHTGPTPTQRRTAANERESDVPIRTLTLWGLIGATLWQCG